jgi:transcriptional regulator with XRE-family HTH domain
VVEVVVHRHERLGGEHDVVTPPGEGLADDDLGLAGGVDICGVDERDAGVERAISSSRRTIGPLERTWLTTTAGPPRSSPRACAESLRRERRRVGASLTDLARRAGIGKSTLSELESGVGNPSLETLWALAVALDIPVARLLEPARAHVTLIRAGDGPELANASPDYRATLLNSFSPGGRQDLYRISADPGEGRRSDPQRPCIIEHVVLSAGRAVVGLTADPETLEPGDYLSYPGDQPHIFQALTPRTTAVLIQESM